MNDKEKMDEKFKLQRILRLQHIAEDRMFAPRPEIALQKTKCGF
jgi:hypothetical protein